MDKADPYEWVKISRHMQSVGTATCDVSNLIMQASDFGEGTAARFVLMSAARDVLSERRRARRGRSELAARKPRPIR